MHAARTISGTLTLTSGKLTTTSANLLTVSNTAANAVSGGSSTAYVNGPLARLLPASLASGSTYSFPVGKAGYNPFELVNPTTNSGGTVTIQAEEFDGSSGGSAGTGLGTLNTDRYWQASAPTGGANFTNTTVRLTDSTVTAANVIGQSSTKTGSYNSIGGTVSGSTITSNTVTGLNFFNIGTAATPTITVTGGPLSFGDRVVGAISTEQTYTVAGSNLTADITVTAPSTDFQVSKTTGTGFGSSVTFTQSGGTVATQTVYVRFTPQSAGAKSGNVTNASTGATTKNVAVSGTGVACPSLFTVDDTLDTPDANPGDGVCDDGSTDHLCTLRAAIMEANALAATACSPLTIDFSVIGTISLGSALPAVNHPNLTISGPGADQITVERSTAPATPDFRIFDINNGKTVNISGLTLTNGKTSAGQDGGAISNSGTLGLSEMVFSGNTAGQSGGAISNSGALTVSSSTISGNTAQFDAGILTDGISATISNTTISGNTATVGQSGALKNQNGTVTLTNCTVSGNNSDALINLATGGATASITLTACTVTDGGLLSFDNGGATSAVINLKNTIVSHTGTTLGTGGTNASIVSQGNNLTNDGGGGFLTGTGDLINANPLLAALGNYGGTTETRPLLPGSPAINAGTSSGAPTNDQRGSSRVGNVDIGAFESQGFAIGITGNGSNQSTTVLTNFANSLTVSIGANNAGEPVNGGQVTFTPPGTGASCTFAGNPATISSNAASSGTVTANATAGSYSVAAGATGATSVNFSLTNLPANTAPSFATVATPSRQQGSAASNSTIATVTDAETAAGSLIVTITSANPSNGVTVSNIQNSGGTITADIVADCTASNASFTLQVSDGSLTGIGTLNVSVTANSAPTVGTYADKTLLTGKNVTVTPSAAPADNGSIASVTATASPNTFTGTFSGNATTGALTITNAAPAGTYTITVTVTDNCGATVQKTFTLTVNPCPTSFTVNNLSDVSDSNAGDGVCATSGGVCTLRAAIEEANALASSCSPLSINFSVTGTITLANGQLLITHPSLTVNGPGASQLTVTGNNASRVFEVNIASTTTINGLTITGGNGIGATDSGSGGGVYSKGKLTLTGCVVTGNTTTGPTIHEGGGVFNAGNQLMTLTNCTISNNTANFGGAGVISFGNLVMTGCTVANNTNTYTSDSGRGGGVETYATTTITNSTISGNHIDNGTGDNAGGVWNCCGPLTIINSTITGNSAAGNSGAPSAGGLLQDSCCGGSVTVLNSIIAGNTGTGGAVADVSGAFVSNGYNLIGDGTGATGFTGTGDQVGTTVTPINPRLATLGSYGGTTQTHALLPGSPAINAGTSSGAPTADQRGSSRFGTTDIGAFESQGFTLAATSGSGQSAVINTAFGLPLKATVMANNAGEPVNGGVVTFTPPVSGASATVAGSPVTIAGGMATTGTVTANAVTGNYSVAASANGATGTNFALTNTCQTITVTNPATTTGTIGTPFSQTFTQTGGIGTTTFSTAGALPTGLTLASNGTLSGTPMQSGTFPITVTATDSNGCTGTGATYTLVINTAGCVSSLTVNNSGDGADATPGDGVCETATGNGFCTLRAAIEESNALTSCTPFTINFSITGTINLASELPYLEHPNLTIQGPGATQLTVTRNAAAQFGIFTVVSDVAVINDLTVSNGNSTDLAGGIYGDKNLTINRCVITGNTAARGGGVVSEGGTISINNSTISGNTATAEGGGVFNWGNEGTSQVTLTNCTISGNTVTAAGGNATAGGLASYAEVDGTAVINLVNCTISGNTATNAANAGGLFSGVEDAGSTADINLKNTILANNSNTQALAGADATITSQGNNLASDNAGGFLTGSGDLTNTNPLLATLANYGGTTQTYALLPGSPAINAGTSSGAPTNDQRGKLRFGATDIGAFESQGFSLAATSGTPQSAVISTAFGLPLKVTVTANDAGEPVNGGKVTFTPPGSGASAAVVGSPVTIASGMATTGTVTANAITGSYNVAASATGATGVNFALTNTCQTITVNNPVANTGTVGTFFTATFTQTGSIGATTFSTTSTLPNGITLSNAGVLSGTPTQTGAFPITVKATDSNNCMGTSVGYTLTINCPTITLSPTTLPGGTINALYSGATITATGGSGSYGFAVTGGALPGGMSLSSGGVLGGTPAQAGFFQFTVTATDANNCTGTRTYGLQVVGTMANCNTVVRAPLAGSFALNQWTSANLAGSATVAITSTIGRSGAGSLEFNSPGSSGKADAIYYWSTSLGNAVAGRTLGSLTGLKFEFYRDDTSTNPAVQYPALRLFFMTPSGKSGYLIWEWANNGIPGTPPTNQWVSQNILSGNFWMRAFGSPSKTIDLYNVTLAQWAGGAQFTDGDGDMAHVLGPDTYILGIEVGIGSGWSGTAHAFADNVFAQFGTSDTICANFEPACNTITFTPASLPAGTVGTLYNQTIVAGSGYSPYTLSLSGTLPNGITFTPATGALSGTPTQSGSFPIIINATDVSGCTGSVNYTLTVNCPTITVNPASLPNGVVGTAYNQTITPSG
ncbi:MAG TPA: choice-of-anchor Q domain-containing protein, partial [Blastocatellia bacterium]|nr:choice-of-anchor Q domain-containing protein [Blastocatellia bacterium]